eukprot:3192149-Rhodomonas_salina.1
MPAPHPPSASPPPPAPSPAPAPCASSSGDEPMRRKQGAGDARAELAERVRVDQSPGFPAGPQSCSQRHGLEVLSQGEQRPG